MAVALFALNIYGLSLPSFFIDLPLFRSFPTLLALLFLCLFVFYMAVVWGMAYDSHKQIYEDSLTRNDYVRSNISFALPVLLPWLVLSGFSDIIGALPFEGPKNLLATTAGEIVYFLTFLLLVTIFGPAIIQKFWQCKPLGEGADRTRIENLCRRAGLKYRNVMHWPIFGGRMITAGVMGLAARFRYILVTDALLRFLAPDEVEAVIAHEIGHIKRRHLLYYLLFFIGYMILSYATFDLIIFMIIYLQPLYGFIARAGIDQSTLLSVAISLVLIFTFLIYFRYIFGYFMRNFERQADTYVYRLFDSAQPLISTFRKISATSRQAPEKPNWHHFSISQRVDYLRRCEADRGWIHRHDRKVRYSMAAFLLALVLISVMGFQLNFGETGRHLNRRFYETILVRELEKHPDDPRILARLGDLYLHRKDYAATAAAYERALRINANNPHVLNNLAWLYATGETSDLRNPRRALHLAKLAFSLDPSPHVLDTLAESFYVNGNFNDAITAERQALERVETGREYYEGQLKKFMEAAREKERDRGSTE